MALVENRKVGHDFEFLEKLEAGIELFGFEVKSLRAGKGTLAGSHVIIRGNEAFLVGSHIPPFQPNNEPKEYDPERPRKLLLSKKEIGELASVERGKGLTIVPISVYNKGKNIKVSLGVARGKKKFDKRETIKKRDVKRDMDRLMKNSNRP